MSSNKEWVLLLKKGTEQEWCSFLTEDQAEGDAKIYREKGWEVVASCEVEVQDIFPAFSIEGYEDDPQAKRFGEVHADCAGGQYHIIGTLGGFEISRDTLISLRKWCDGALKLVGKEQKK